MKELMSFFWETLLVCGSLSTGAVIILKTRYFICSFANTLHRKTRSICNTTFKHITFWYAENRWQYIISDDIQIVTFLHEKKSTIMWISLWLSPLKRRLHRITLVYRMQQKHFGLKDFKVILQNLRHFIIHLKSVWS